MRQMFKTEALILNKKPLLEKNILLTFFTKDLGKIKVFAFGAKKITSRRLSYFENGNFLKIILEKKNDRFYLKEVSLIFGFLSIKEDKKKWPAFYLYFYILEKILPENLRDEKNYQLTLNFLVNLSKKQFNLDDLNFYLNFLLKNLGYLNQSQSFKENITTIENIIDEKLPKFTL